MAAFPPLPVCRPDRVPRLLGAPLRPMETVLPAKVLAVTEAGLARHAQVRFDALLGDGTVVVKVGLARGRDPEPGALGAAEEVLVLVPCEPELRVEETRPLEDRALH